MKKKFIAALAAARASVKRDLGVFFVMMILAVIAAVVTVPVVLILVLIPGWAFSAVTAAFIIWLVFGETIRSTMRAYRREKP